ncbi:MAG TPA: hypothetical protein VK809_01410, partial [Bacteroidia bacterium]|nr:hypothetical protein [Bacteroidia bacterium]
MTGSVFKNEEGGGFAAPFLITKSAKTRSCRTCFGIFPFFLIKKSILEIEPQSLFCLTLQLSFSIFVLLPLKT